MKRFSKNLLALAAADLLRRIAGFMTVAYLARILGAEAFGALNIAYAVLAYGLVLSSGGLVTIGIRSIAQGASDAVVGRILGERFVMTLVVFLLIAGIALLFISDPLTTMLTVLFALVLFPQSLSLEWYFQGKETMNIVAITRSFSPIVSMLAALLFVRTPSDLWLLAFGTLLGEALATFVLWRKYRNGATLFRVNFSLTMELFRTSLPLTTGVIIATLVINFPPLALGVVRTAEEVGVYSAASKLVFFLLIGDRLLSSLLLPASSRKVSVSSEQLTELAEDAVRWTILIALPSVVGGMLIANPLIQLIFGNNYSSAVPVLQVFLWYFFLTMLHTIATSLLLALHQEKTYSRVMGITALFYLCFVSLGGYFFGATGAAAGVVLAEGGSLLLLWQSLRSHVSIPLLTSVSRCIVATVSMAIVVWRVSSFPLLFQILLGALVYIVAAFLTNAVRWSDVRKLMDKVR